MADHSEAIAMFTSIIADAEPNVAEHYLAACDWDINRAVEFYLENPPDGGAHHAFEGPSAGPGGGGGQPDLAVHGSTLPTSRPFPAFRPPNAQPAAPPPQPEVYDLIDDEDEDELQRALQASLAGSGPEATGVARMEYEESEELQALRRQRIAEVEALALRPNQNAELLAPAALPANNFPAFRPNPNHRPPTRSTSGPSSRRRRASPPTRRAPAAPAPPTREPLSHPPAPLVYNLDSDEDYVDEIPPLARRSAAGGSADEHPLPDLPEGINIEEARMLEAAMLGVPYEGRMPSFDSRPQPPQSPRAVAARNLRQEQDEAYEESLRADRAKAAAEAALKREQEQVAERARQEAEAEARRKQEEEEAAARAAAEAEQRLMRSLAMKAQRVPEEPPADDPEAVLLMVRMPDGGRTSRRYRRTDPLQAVFDHLDVQAQGEGLKPGQYNLVTQFPRKVFAEGVKETLAEAGLTARQEALFIELISS